MTEASVGLRCMMMFAQKIHVAIVGALLLGTACFAHAEKTRGATHPKVKKHHAPKHPVVHPASQKVTHHYTRKRKRRKRGQQAIDDARARQIQNALVREHYFKGQPSGKWDAATQDAMRRYQADQGWQTKEVPDARSLIRLGLGPDHDHLLNPESAMTTGPHVHHNSATEAPVQASGTSAHPISPSASASAAGSSAAGPDSPPAASPVTPAPDLSPSR